VHFAAGFNVLTGETGAGKSILVDALHLVLGGRAQADSCAPGPRRPRCRRCSARATPGSATRAFQAWAASGGRGAGGPAHRPARGPQPRLGERRAGHGGAAPGRHPGLLDISGQHEHVGLLDASLHSISSMPMRSSAIRGRDSGRRSPRWRRRRKRRAARFGRVAAGPARRLVEIPARRAGEDRAAARRGRPLSLARVLGLAGQLRRQRRTEAVLAERSPAGQRQRLSSPGCGAVFSSSSSWNFNQSARWAAATRPNRAARALSPPPPARRTPARISPADRRAAHGHRGDRGAARRPAGRRARAGRDVEQARVAAWSCAAVASAPFTQARLRPSRWTVRRTTSSAPAAGRPRPERRASHSPGSRGRNSACTSASSAPVRTESAWARPRAPGAAHRPGCSSPLPSRRSAR